MKFRKFFLGLKLWARTVRARRELKRLKQKLKKLHVRKNAQIRALVKHYEQQLAVERVRIEATHQAWADRWLQKDKLAPLGISTTLLEERANSKLPEQFRQQEFEETLNPVQLMELQDRRDLFFKDGLALQKSIAEINNRWQDIKDDVIADIRLAVN